MFQRFKPNFAKILRIKKIEIIKWLGWVLFFILLFLKCNKNNDSEIIEDYESKKEKSIAEINESKRIISSLEKDIKILKKENDSIIKSKNKYIAGKVEYIEKIKKFDIDDQQKYFTLNYKQLINPKKLVKLDSLQSFNIITDIEKGKVAFYEVGELSKILSNNNKQIGNYELQFLEFEKIEENYNSVIEDCEKALYESQKEVKFRLLTGGGFGLDKEISQGIYKVNLGFQNKKGNILRASYLNIGSKQFGVLEYDLSIFTIKR